MNRNKRLGLVVGIGALGGLALATVAGIALAGNPPASDPYVAPQNYGYTLPNANKAVTADSATNATNAQHANKADSATQCTGTASQCGTTTNVSGSSGPTYTYQWVTYGTVSGSHSDSFRGTMIGMPQYSWYLTEKREREYINGQETMSPAVWQTISSADTTALNECGSTSSGGISSYPPCDAGLAGVTVSGCHDVYNGQIGSLVCNITYSSSTMQLSGTGSCFLYENNTTPEKPCSNWP